MQLSKNTISILRNFSSINQGIQFVEGNEIRVGAVDKSVMGIAKVEETFPIDFAIYNLKQFLTVLSMFDNPDLKFYDEYVSIEEGRESIKYYYTSSDNIVGAPYDIEFIGSDERVQITSTQLDRLTKASNAMALNHFSVVHEDNQLELIVEDGEQDSNHEFTISLDFDSDLGDFEAQMMMKNINFVSYDYDISFTDGQEHLIFENSEHGLTYYVATLVL